jgi:hypothetical protein
MEATERDSTQDWLLPEGAAPPLMSELALRVDEALAIARASEQAVKVVGDAAIDAAKQALRAAELAERASATVLQANRAAATRPPEGARGTAVIGSPEDASLRRFSERADRVVARLRALEGLPRRVRTSSAAAGHRRPGG